MKFLHIADLHLGKKLNDISLLEDQKYALEQVVKIAQEVDAVLIAGDIYDKSTPTAEAMSLFDDFLTKLVDMNKKIYLISGNHDSDQRISYFSSLINNVGVYPTNEFTGKLQSYQLQDEYGVINIHLLPFIKPINVRKFFPKEKIESYQQAIEAIIRNSTYNKEERNILICHQFITGAQLSDSEQLAVGGLDNINADVFNDFDYVALGHIHKPQSVDRPTLRYSGSLLKYSLSEANHHKGVCIIDVKEKGNIEIKNVELNYLHDVREIEGYFADIMQMPYSQDYVRVTLHDELIYPDARIRLLTVFPNMMKYAISNSKTKVDIDVLAQENFENKSIQDLFKDFYALQNNNVAPSQETMDLFEEVLKELED